MDFNYAGELLKLCEETKLPISEVMKRREMDFSSMTAQEVEEKMRKSLEIMKTAAKEPLENEKPSMGGLIGGEAKLLFSQKGKEKDICGDVVLKAITYAMAVLEVNASMGVIVAAPTAGSAGVIPGVFLALKEEKALSDEILLKGLYTAGAVGYLLMRNASVAGAEAGCQAEVGAASAMAAAAVTELMGGTPQMCLQAAAMAISNLLGLVCDPVAGLVEVPCIKRNSCGAVNAVTSAQLALAGIRSAIAPDDVIDSMRRIGNQLPPCLKETSEGGLAVTESARVYQRHSNKRRVEK